MPYFLFNQVSLREISIFFQMQRFLSCIINNLILVSNLQVQTVAFQVIYYATNKLDASDVN